jgi:hypothetical protein
VDLLNTANGREYFKVLEGANSGKQFSVKLRGPGQSYLSPSVALQGPASVKLVRKKQELYFGAKGPFSAFTESANPVPVGIRDIEIPDAPHVNHYGGTPSWTTLGFTSGTTQPRIAIFTAA